MVNDNTPAGVIQCNLRKLLCCLTVNTSCISTIPIPIYILLTLFSIVGFTYGSHFYEFSFTVWLLVGFFCTVVLICIIFVIVACISVWYILTEEFLNEKKIDFVEQLSVHIWNTSIISAIVCIFTVLSQIIGTIIMSLSMKHLVCNYISFNVGLYTLIALLIIIAIVVSIITFFIYLIYLSINYTRKCYPINISINNNYTPI